MSNWDRFLDSFFNASVIARYWPSIVEGFWLTAVLALEVVVAGIALGLLLAILRSLGIRPLDWLIAFYADVMRALPPLVFIIFLYFGLPNAGISLSGYMVVWLTLTLVLGAFAEEIFRAGIISVQRGQWEAARSTGLTHLQTIVYVVLPQAVRLAIPPLTNRTIAVSKNTALGTVVGVGEILNQATTAQSFSGNASPLMLGTLAYLILFVPVVIAGRWIETRYRWKRQ